MKTYPYRRIFFWLKDLLQARQSEDQIPEGVQLSSPVKTGPGAHSASYTMSTMSLPGVKCTSAPF
jgi:hypothetical protein